MTDDETPCLHAIAEQQEPVFISGMIGIINQTCTLVQKSGLRFFEGHTVLDRVGLRLTSVPGEAYIAHSIIIAIRNTGGVSGRGCEVPRDRPLMLAASCNTPRLLRRIAEISYRGVRLRELRARWKA